jgi:hypothetical protein
MINISGRLAYLDEADRLLRLRRECRSDPELQIDLWHRASAYMHAAGCDFDGADRLEDMSHRLRVELLRMQLGESVPVKVQ